MLKLGWRKIIAYKYFWLLMPVSLAGCASLLPHFKQETQIPWHNYAEAEAIFIKITPGETSLETLKKIGIDPTLTPNVNLLGHADMLRRLVVTSPSDIRLIDPCLLSCIPYTSGCFAYEIEHKHQERQRFGNVWLDLLGFKRRTAISGWEFDAIFVIKNNYVIYKQWSGKPNIHQFEEELNPLGPFQNIGTSSSH